MRITKGNPARKRARQWKREVKAKTYALHGLNGPQAVARRKRQIDAGRLKPT